MKILVTGSSGYFAWELIRQLNNKENVEIFALTSDINTLKHDDNYNHARIISNADLSDVLSKNNIDFIVHTAYCRKSIGFALYDSQLFSAKVFKEAAKYKVKGVINLSSQSVYGGDKDNLPNEDGMISPDYLYALSKASSELLLHTIIEEQECDTRYVSLRLASLIGPSKTVPNNVLYKFVENALNGKDIIINGGQQNFSFLDVRDAADAVIRLMEIPCLHWEKVYNLGADKQCNIKDLALLAVNNVEELGYSSVNIIVNEDDIYLNAGMNSEKLYQALKWKPKYSIRDSISATSSYILMTNNQTI